MLPRGDGGADIRPRILAAPTAPVIVKEFADGFVKTMLEETLAKLGVAELLVCGMMAQNRVTHTAVSKAAEKYAVTILPDCCTAVGEVLHLIALHALSYTGGPRAFGRSDVARPRLDRGTIDEPPSSLPTSAAFPHPFAR